MSLYQVQKFLYNLNRDEQVQQAFSKNKNDVLSDYDLIQEEYGALHSGDIGLLYVLGVNGQILMHYADDPEARENLVRVYETYQHNPTSQALAFHHGITQNEADENLRETR